MQGLYGLEEYREPVIMTKTHSSGMEHGGGRSDAVMFGVCCKFHGHPISLSVIGGGLICSLIHQAFDVEHTSSGKRVCCSLVRVFLITG